MTMRRLPSISMRFPDGEDDEEQELGERRVKQAQRYMGVSELLADCGQRQARAFPPLGDVIEAREHKNGRQRDPSVERGRFNKAAQHDTQERNNSLSIVIPRHP